MDLQKRCHVLIESNKHNPQIQLSAIAELHRLNITLSNYIDVLPTVINDSTFSAAPEVKTPKNQNGHHQTSQSSHSLDILHGVPFWIWDKSLHLQKAIETNQNCCFNHICGLPTKEGKEYPLFDYEKIMFDTLMNSSSSIAVTTIAHRPKSTSTDFKDKHLWIKKATGLGISEFMLRLMAWLCVYDNSYRGAQMCIVTGPNIDIAIKLIKRLKGIFEPKLNIIFDNKETVIVLNDCTIEAYPSNHLDRLQGPDKSQVYFIR